MKELEKSELTEVDGGVFPAIAIGLAIFAAVVGDWDNFERGLFGKPCKNS